MRNIFDNLVWLPPPLSVYGKDRPLCPPRGNPTLQCASYPPPPIEGHRFFYAVMLPSLEVKKLLRCEKYYSKPSRSLR